MRLTRYKVEYLTDKVLKLFQENSRIHFDNADLVARSVYDSILANLEAEDEIDEEVEAMLDQYRGEISAMEMDMGMLRNKIKREVAKKRGFTL